MPTAPAAPAATTNYSAPTLSKGGIVATPTTQTTPAQVAAAESSGFKPVASSPQVSSPTVLSDSNIRDSVIPSLNAAAGQMKTTPTMITPAQANTTGETAGKDNTNNKETDKSTTSDGMNFADIYNKVFGGEANTPVDPETSRSISMLEAMKTSNDASYSSQVDTIKNQFATNQSLQEEANNRASHTVNNQLFHTGAYRTSAAANVPLAVRSAQINALANLQTKENEAIARVQTARQNSDYKTMHAEMAVYDKVRADKKALASKISTHLLSENEKLLKNKMQNTIDNEVATALSSGMTDSADILKSISDKGLNVTASDINTSLSTIAKLNNMDLVGFSGNVKNFFSLKESGSLPTNIKSLRFGYMLKVFFYLELSSNSKTTNSTKPLYTTVKGSPVTKNDLEAGVQKLDDSKGDDGFVDPNLYLSMFKYWEDEGLPPNEFIKQYPPKYYINPANNSLPAYLRPTVGGSKSTSSGVKSGADIFPEAK